jgi:L-ascorbate metabolism protein UlaG (beta-lactamase superfamily)
MQLTYLGHSCFLLEVSGKKLVFDPFIRPNELAAKINFDELQADYILVSHGHDDHTADLLDLAKNTNAKVISSWEICVWLNKHGITNTHPMNIGGKWQFDDITIHMVFAAHSSSLADGSYAGIAAGFVVEGAGKVLYYAGDTALHTDMKLLADKFTLDAALLPIGDNFTMGYEDACKAATFIGCERIIAMHFDTFGYIKVPHTVAVDHFNKYGKLLTIPAIGSTLTI